MNIREKVAGIASPVSAPAARRAARRLAFVLAWSAALGGCTFTPWPSSKTADDAAPTDATATPFDAARQEVPPLLPAGPAAASGAAAASAPAGDTAPGYYRVKPGDTLYRIATTHGQRVADVSSWNKLPESGQVQVGQLLRIAPPVPGATADAGAAGSAPASASAAHGKTRLVWPISGSVATPFVAGKSKGVVIAGAAGQPVKAAAAGRVVYAGDGIKTYGQLVIVKHDANLITAYGRNSKLVVKEGDVVKQGEVIAQSGTDRAGKASLVFEVRENGKPVDPVAQLPEARP